MKNHLDALRWIALHKSKEEYEKALAVASILHKWVDTEEIIINGLLKTENSPAIKTAYLYVQLLDDLLMDEKISYFREVAINTRLIQGKVNDKVWEDWINLINAFGLLEN